MSAIRINIIMKRKKTSDGAKIAPFETVRVIAMRKLHERNMVNDVFPNGAVFTEWEWVMVGDDTDLKIMWDDEFQAMKEHYEVVQ